MNLAACGLYPLDTGSKAPAVTTKNDSRHCQCPLEGRYLRTILPCSVSATIIIILIRITTHVLTIFPGILPIMFLWYFYLIKKSYVSVLFVSHFTTEETKAQETRRMSNDFSCLYILGDFQCHCPESSEHLPCNYPSILWKN